MSKVQERASAIVVLLRDLDCELSHITDLLSLEYRHHSFDWGFDGKQHYVKMSGKEIWRE